MKLTEEQIKENLACYEQAMRTGSVNGIETSTEEEEEKEFKDKMSSSFYPHCIYRRKPQPKLVPYDVETWPLDAGWVRIPEFSNYPLKPIDIRREGIGALISSIARTLSWDELLQNYELTRNNGKTWEPCGRVV